MGRQIARRRRPLSRMGVIGLALCCAWGALLVPVVGDPVRDAAIAPLPGLWPGAVDLLVAVVNGLRWVAPFAASAGVAVFVLLTLSRRRSERERVLSRLSMIEYSGVDHVVRGRQQRWPPVRAVSEFFRGGGLATLAVLLIGATSGIEDEVTSGPLRPIDALNQMLGLEHVTFVLHSPALTFMDDSSIPAEQMARFQEASSVLVIPFGKNLFNVNDKSALELSVPDDIYAGLSGAPEPSSSSCSERTIIVNDTVGAGTGDHVTVNGQPLRVAKVEAGIAQMNRSVAVLSDSTVRRCIEGGTNASYFGALVASADLGMVDRTLDAVGVAAVAVSEAEFREHNRDFWRANATPLLLQLILYLALFSALAAAGERQAALQRNSREIGMLHAAGVTLATLQAVERRRALRTTVKATLLAGPLMVLVAAAFNASELGVQISVGVIEVAVGFSLTLGAVLLASHHSFAQFGKSLDLPLAVKG